MEKVFLSHASEDKLIVEHIYHKLKTRYNNLDPWLDKYEIIGGDSLIDKIADGINESNKFIIFLSESSIKKPWVIKELKKAIIREVDSSENFIIPVLVNSIQNIPSFLEDKFYINIKDKTETEFITEIYNAISNNSPDSLGDTIDNVVVDTSVKGTHLQIHVSTKFWAEMISFEIILSKIYKSVFYCFEKCPNTFDGQYLEEKDKNVYRICLPSHRISSSNKLIIDFEFEDESFVQLVNFRNWKEGLSKKCEYKMEIRG